MAGAPFLQQLQRKVLGHPVLRHPFLRRFAHGPFTLDQARRFALAYYPHILRPRLYQAACLSLCPDEELQLAFAQILQDEYAGGRRDKTHMAQYRHFMEELGLTARQWKTALMIPELALYVDRHERLTRRDHFLAAVGAAGIAMEWPIPAIYAQLVKGFRRLPTIPTAGLVFFTGHMAMDLEHAGTIRRALRSHLVVPENRRNLQRGAMASLDARFIFYTGLFREVFVTKI